MSNDVQGRVMLKDVRLSFPKLFVPDSYAENALAFSATFLIYKDDKFYEENYKKLILAKNQAVAKKFNSKEPLIRDPKRIFISDGNKNLDKDGNIINGYKDAVVIRSKRRADPSSNEPNDRVHESKRPRLFSQKKEPITFDDGTFYGGCRVDAIISVYGTDKGGPGIFSTLEAVRFRRDGEAFGSPKVTADEFEDIDEEYVDDGMDLF